MKEHLFDLAHAVEGHEDDGGAFVAGAAGAAAAVHEGGGVDGGIGVDDEANAREVDAAGGDVGAHQHAGAAVAHALQRALSFALRQLTAQGASEEAALDEASGEARRAFARLAEHEGGGRLMQAQHVDDGGLALAGVDEVHDVGDVFVLCALLFGRDAHGACGVALGERHGLSRHGRREQQCSARGGGFVEDAFELVAKAHVEHLVGFVEHDAAHIFGVEGTAREVIEHAPRCADDDVGAEEQGAGFGAGIGAADDGAHGDAGVFAEPAQLAGDLLGELARRRDDEGAGQGAFLRLGGDAAFVEEHGQHSEAEGDGFAGAGLAANEEIGVRVARRDRLLHRRASVVALGGKGLTQGLRQREFVEAHGRSRSMSRARVTVSFIVHAMDLALPFIVALHVAAAGEPQWPSVATPLPPQGGGVDDSAVVVGISDYLVLPDIQGAADNARDWAQHLVRVRGLKNERVALFTEGEATKERILRALDAAVAATGPKGRVWFIFVGHGAPSPGGDDGMLLGADAQPDMDSLAARGLPQRLIEAALDKGKQREAVVVYDACFSGRSHDGEQALVPNTQATLPVRRVTPPKSKTIVLASSESFAGPLPGEARPAFSYLLLGAARGWASDDNNDGAVSIDEAYLFAKDTMTAALKQSARQPVRRGAASGVVLATKASEAAPDVTALVMRRCPDGTRWGGRSCVLDDRPPPVAATVACPPGTSWSGTACVVTTVACPQGTRWDGARCVVDGAAPAPAPSAIAGIEQEVAVLKKFHDAGVLVTDHQGTTIFTDRVFMRGGIELTSEGRQLLHALVRVILAKAPDEKYVIECHTDSAGVAALNTMLTQQRAKVIGEAFRDASFGRIKGNYQGWGSSKPLDARWPERNRRCYIHN